MDEIMGEQKTSECKDNTYQNTGVMPAKGTPAQESRKVDYWKISTLLLSILSILLIISVFTGFNPFQSGISKEEAASRALNVINTNLLQGQAVASLEGVEEQGDVYLMKISVSGREIEGYITKDGKLFFPQGISLTEEALAEASASDDSPQAVEVTKSDKPKVELFIMSQCPYGTQIEKGILPVAYLLGDKIDFSIKFVSYAMHGEPEIKEQLNQHCIEKEQNIKFLDYLECFLEDGNGERCIAEVGIDKQKMDACIVKADQEFSVMKNLADQSSWLSGRYPQFNIHKKENELYGVQGSPTLIINGEIVSTGRDSVSLLNAVCSAFNTLPEECNSELDATAPSPGFGWEASGTNNLASCGS